MHMLRKSLGSKILCGALAFGLCLNMGISMPMTVHAEDPAPELVVASGATWNGTDDVRVYVNAADGMAVDESKYQITEGADKYELVDGHLRLKDGETAVDGDRITIGAAVSYYTEDQLLWSDGLETDGSLIPSNAGYYALTHTEAMAHNGLKSGTTNSEKVKDGLWSPNINSTGRLVFWYYDPASEDEMNPDNVTDETWNNGKGFDQVKFGMAINGYSNFLMGIGIPADTELTSGFEKTEYLNVYTVRESGTWKPTNIARSKGWHKMEADVTAEGTRVYIDGNAVSYKGSDTPILVTGVTSIEKAAVATNWANKYEVMQFIEGKHFIDDLYILKSDAGEAKTAELTATITVDKESIVEEPEMALTFGEDNTGALVKGETGRVYLDNSADYAIESVKYTTDNENIFVSQDGTLSYAPGYTPQAGETVTVTAEVTYYDPEGVVFQDSFEGEKQFTDGGVEGVYTHSAAGSLYGRKAATPAGSTNGYPAKNLEEISDVTVTVWYYDANGGADQTKYGFSINGNGNALGIFYDGTIASYVDNLTKTHYGARLAGCTYNNYAFGTTDVERSTGWHKFEWVIDSETGLTEKIDGKVISTNTLVGQAETNYELMKVENYDKIKSLTSLNLLEGWNNNSTNLGEIQNRHFIDGVTVVKNGTQTASKTLTSAAIPLQDVEYTVTPNTLEVDTTYPKDQTMYISPYVEGDTDVVKVLVDDTELAAEQWSAGMGETPDNALNYPAEMKGYQVTVKADALKDLTEGAHSVTLVTKSGSEIAVNAEAAATEHTAANYYLSNNGDDNNDGHTPETAWATFEKLQEVTFGAGDHIYLDAESTWSGVQFRPEGSGAEGSPVVMTKYNDGGDSSKRPILNGDGTVADLDAHTYAAFDTWRKFYPSGTIELINVEQWEVRGIEITNYTQEMQKGATGRNGIAVIYDYMEVQDITPEAAVAMSNAEKEQAFYRAGKLQHVVIDDCYIHDVVGYHPINGAVGAGGKMSGGINAYGPYDDLQLNNNIVMYCDVEGIRNDVLAWMGDTRTQFPSYMENVSISNNYIAGVPGDGVVISSANQPILENNYLTDAGYSYYATSNTSNVSGVTWSTNNLASCRDVTAKTGGTVKEMGNRQSPMTMGSTNFAGLWFIGTKDAVAQYNEAVNNVWVCNDSEAFDADMYCWGTIFQYNYTYRNNGGFCLFMATMDDGTVVRYNVSVEDAESYGLVGGESQNGLFHYSGAPEAIYNNLFILSDKLATIFGGPANTTYFYNNIVAAPNGLLAEGTFDGFHINGSSDGKIQNPALGGEMKNNIFTEGILDTIVDGSSVVLENNIEVKTEDLDKVFRDLDGFMDAQPVKALLGRSDFTGEKVETLEYGKGAGVAMSAQAGRSVQVPTGGFDLTQFEGIKLAEDSPAIGAGISADEMHAYDYKAQNDAVNPLTQDFFEQDITNLSSVDIGPFQSQGKAAHKHTLTLQAGYAATCTETGRKDYYICDDCGLAFWDAEGTEPVEDENELIIPAAGHTESEWKTDETGHWKECTVCGEVTTEKIAHTDEDADNYCDICGYEFGVEHVHADNLTKVEAKEATCTEDGNIEYYTCSCGKWFSDAEGTEEITDKASVIIKATGHVDEDEDGKCDVCGKDMGTGTPGTDEPGTDEPGTDQPGTDKPGTDEPGTDKPGTDKPGTDQPGTDKPGTDKPGTDQPGTDQPAQNQSGTDKPGTNKPAQNQPGTVKTGDTANIVLWTVIIIAAGAAMIGAVLVRRKNAKGRRR